MAIFTSGYPEESSTLCKLLHRQAVDLEGFLKVVKSIDSFWLSVVKLPRGARS
jgi:hypothetical protein